jgi:hypothetical protein
MRSQDKNVSDRRRAHLWSKWLMVMLFSLMAARASATAQFPVTLFIDGQARSLFAQSLAALESAEPKALQTLGRGPAACSGRLG